MRKVWTIAHRDYIAAVKTRSFLVGLILMPVMMFGSLIVGRLTKDIVDVTDKHVAIVDRTPGATLADAIVAASEARNAHRTTDAKTGRQTAARFYFEKVEPAGPDDPAEVQKQRYELSERVRKNELFAFLEIGKDILEPKLPTPSTQATEKAREAAAGFDIDARLDAAAETLGDDSIVRYTTNRPTYGDVRSFVQETVAANAQLRRARAAGVDPAVVAAVARPPLVANKPLYDRRSDGGIREGARQGQFMSLFVPLAMMLLMFLVVIIGSSQLATNVVEEKQLRIAEVLLGSVKPFELMLGKLLGGVGVSLTLALVYIAGAYLGAREFEITKYLTPGVLATFIGFAVLATFMYGSLFVAAGAAVTNLKEAQSFITPIMLLVMLPLFVFGPILNNPNGPVAVGASLFPFSAPMVTVMRLGIPPGIPPWQAIASALITLAVAAVIVWAAGRIFRVGILMQGQSARIGQILRWVFTG